MPRAAFLPGRSLAPRMIDALGLPSGSVIVRPHDARWAALYQEAAAELLLVAGPAILSVEHVGSTAVPGLAAKPIIDMLASVANFDAALALVPLLEPLGYEFRPGEDIPDRHYFRRRVGALRTHHLSLALPSSRFHRDTIAFRDALRGDTRLAVRYQLLKLGLAARYPHDRQSYLEGKSAFVAEVLRGNG